MGLVLRDWPSVCGLGFNRQETGLALMVPSASDLDMGAMYSGIAARDTGTGTDVLGLASGSLAQLLGIRSLVRIMACESAKAIWNFLKAEYQGDERIRSMKGLNLITEFERLQMKESETIKEYSDKLISIANQKILVSLPERFEATIASLENTKDLSQIKLAELLSALQAQEQRRLMRLEGSTKGALQAKEQQNVGGKGKKWKGKKRNGSSGSEAAAGENSACNSKNNWRRYSSCQHCGKQNHPHFRCCKRPDVRRKKCHKLGHIEKFCKVKGDQQQGEAHAAVQQEVDQLFVAFCFSSSTPCDNWLVDSGYTNHMTIDEKLFIDLDKSLKSRVRIGNGEYLEVKGKGTIAIESCGGTKLVSNVMYVPEINQNLLIVGQLVEKGFKVIFEEGKCLIFDFSG
ncbi:uncharacterized protein LOC115692343 [Syzygium oleosum]|uniref:uncharacterized protein LOC115692343 n=1 Tax=Syzygium oleosum TaxID=219896 RepID=UPI0024B92127|nr:uncharacterized protein LOC115692343 [Syzygium oleosum]